MVHTSSCSFISKRFETSQSQNIIATLVKVIYKETPFNFVFAVRKHRQIRSISFLPRGLASCMHAMARETTIVITSDTTCEDCASGETSEHQQLQESSTNGSTGLDKFVFPSERGMDATASDFDSEAFLDELAVDVMHLQHAKLREILEMQAGAEYLQRHGLNGRTDVESFRKCVPVVSYGDLETDILRLVNGETTAPIFTVDPVTEFHVSSGTTGGKPKYIPSTARAYNEERRFFFTFLDASLRRAFPGLARGKVLNLAFAGKHLVTPSGLKAGAMTTNIYRSAHFRNRERADDEMCVPDEVILCEDTNQGMYCHLLCALARAPEIVKVAAVFAVTVVTAARALQQQWRELASDIRTGTLNSQIIKSPDLRAALKNTLHPDPDLANRIELECSQENWEGIFPRLFPNAHFVQCILSGSMLQYAPTLKHFAGNLPLVSIGYASSECGHIALNPRMNCDLEEITYLPWVERIYFEFIPVNDGVDGHGVCEKVLEACELEVGREYELVVTNETGFYRYRVGDVIRVTSFRNTMPVFAFVRRMNVCLSVHTDKTDEEELQAVVDKAAKLLREAQPAMELSDYTAASDVSSLPGRYIIFLEMVDSSNLDPNVLQKCANTLDASFNFVYRRWRSKGQIGPLELRILREGTFHKMLNGAVAKGASPIQYKLPRCVNNQLQELGVLQDGTIGSFRSTITPESSEARIPRKSYE